MLGNPAGRGMRGGASSRDPLHRDQADTTRGSMDKHALHRSKLRLNEAVVRRDPHDRKRDGLIEGEHCRQITVSMHENRNA